MCKKMARARTGPARTRTRTRPHGQTEPRSPIRADITKWKSGSSDGRQNPTPKQKGQKENKMGKIQRRWVCELPTNKMQTKNRARREDRGFRTNNTRTHARARTRAHVPALAPHSPRTHPHAHAPTRPRTAWHAPHWSRTHTPAKPRTAPHARPHTRTPQAPEHGRHQNAY